MLPIATLALAGNLVVAVADTVPNLAVEQSCRAQATRAGEMPHGDPDSCLRSERAAHDKLRAEWSGFSEADRRHCDITATMGGEPSYVELLTCLEMTAEAARLRDHPIDSEGLGEQPLRRQRVQPPGHG